MNAGLELPRAALGPRPGTALQSGGVRQQHPDGDAVGRTIGIVDQPELGYPAGGGVVEVELPLVAQLHDGNAGKRLGDRTPVEEGALVDPPSGCPVGEAVVVAGQDLPVPNECRAGADDAVGIGVCVDLLNEVGPPLGNRWCLGALGLRGCNEHTEQSCGESRHCVPCCQTCRSEGPRTDP